MKHIIVIGLQWGDEGKGKIVDVLSKEVDAVIRFQGGANAGHTVIANNKKIILHLLPTGILQNKVSIIGNGVVVDIEALLEEINEIKSFGFNTDKLYISSRSHLLLPTHKILDSIKENNREHKIGTTKRGIGPAYTDKFARKGIRMGELFDRERFIEKLKNHIMLFNNTIKLYDNIESINVDEMIERVLNIRESIINYVVETEPIIEELIHKDKRILFEGAQGTLLDIDYGTYPYVTSSHPVSSYAFCGGGVPILKNTEIIGISKAYTTRVGEGPFPTRMNKENENRMREMGQEYGATTGRGRNCGWLDLFALKYACFINAVDSIALTKIDVMSGWEKIKLCTGYIYNNKQLKTFPANTEILNNVQPQYIEMDGWNKEDIEYLKNGNIVKSIKNYIEFIEDYTNTKINMLSIGPDRKDILFLKDNN